MAEPRVILAATDFSATSRGALHAARDLAAALQAVLHVVHVIPDPSRLPWSIDAGVTYPVLEQGWRAQAENGLDEARREARLPASTTTTVLIGDAAPAILDEADRLSAHMIVLGTHGHGRLARLVMGSVADRVLRHTQRPVLVVPPVRFEGGVS